MDKVQKGVAGRKTTLDNPDSSANWLPEVLKKGGTFSFPKAEVGREKTKGLRTGRSASERTGEVGDGMSFSSRLEHERRLEAAREQRQQRPSYSLPRPDRSKDPFPKYKETLQFLDALSETEEGNSLAQIKCDRQKRMYVSARVFEYFDVWKALPERFRESAEAAWYLCLVPSGCGFPVFPKKGEELRVISCSHRQDGSSGGGGGGDVNENGSNSDDDDDFLSEDSNETIVRVKDVISDRGYRGRTAMVKLGLGVRMMM